MWRGHRFAPTSNITVFCTPPFLYWGQNGNHSCFGLNELLGLPMHWNPTQSGLLIARRFFIQIYDLAGWNAKVGRRERVAMGDAEGGSSIMTHAIFTYYINIVKTVSEWGHCGHTDLDSYRGEVTMQLEVFKQFWWPLIAWQNRPSHFKIEQWLPSPLGDWLL